MIVQGADEGEERGGVDIAVRQRIRNQRQQAKCQKRDLARLNQYVREARKALGMAA